MVYTENRLIVMFCALHVANVIKFVGMKEDFILKCYCIIKIKPNEMFITCLTRLIKAICPGELLVLTSF